MTVERVRPSFAFTQERLAQLRAVVPEAFADGRINWDVLREALGETVEPEGQDAEHFGLFWPGKREARRLAAIPSRGTLVPAPGDGVKEASTRNIFIEGENLEVLKLLHKSYAGHVKAIYIDPPYNTGNDFVYKDDFTDPLDDYLRKTGQLGAAAEPLTTNTRSDGRFHSNWLSMMYPRLILARDLLTDTGLIFVSIDDNEVTGLRAIMNEIFGEENFLETLIWKKSYGGAREKYIVRQHEYVITFAKHREALPHLWLPPDPTVLAKYYKFRDQNFDFRGPYRLQPLEAAKSMDRRPNLVFPIPLPKGGQLKPKRQWLWGKTRVLDALAAGEIVFTKTSKGTTASYKQYLRDESGDERGSKPTSVLDGPYTQEGTRDLEVLFDGKAPIQFPKPVGLISRLLKIGTRTAGDDVVMDFFAGSATTAEAVLQLNREDGGTRSFVCVQLPEAIDHRQFRNVADIAKERIRRVCRKMSKTGSSKPQEDLGFRALKLVNSHFRAWQDYAGTSPDELASLFESAGSPLLDGWTHAGLLTEMLLLEGFPLSAAVERLVAVKHNNVQVVTSQDCQHRLLVCLDNRISEQTLHDFTVAREDVFVCLDTALTDTIKLRLADRCTLKTI
jgi:adenine-specific DNA-methyltransferase